MAISSISDTVSHIMQTGSFNVLFSAQTQIQNANSQTHPQSSNEGLPAPHCYISPSPLACFTNINTPTPPNTTHFFIYIHPLQHLTTTLHFISTPDVARTTSSSSFHSYCKRARFPTIVKHD